MTGGVVASLLTEKKKSRVSFVTLPEDSGLDGGGQRIHGEARLTNHMDTVLRARLTANISGADDPLHPQSTSTSSAKESWALYQMYRFQ